MRLLNYINQWKNKAYLIAIGFLILQSNGFSQANSTFVIDTSCTPIEIILAIEKAEDFNYPTKLYNWLDSLQNLKIDTHKISNNGQFHQVNKHLINEAKKLDSYLGTMGQCLQYKYFDCDILSFLLLSYFEHSQVDICGFWNEKHMWIGDCNNLNCQWETTTLKNETINHYYKKYGVPNAYKHNSNYYKPLFKTDFIAWTYFQLANKYYTIKDYDLALKYCFKALSFSDDWPKIYELIGDIYWTENDLNKAETAYYQAYFLFKLDKVVSQKLRKTYQQLGCFEEAKEL